MRLFRDRKRRIYSEIEVVSVAAEEKSGGVEMERIGSSDLAEQDVYSRSEECESGDEFSTSSIGCSFSRTAGELCGDPEEASIINPSKRPRQPPANHRRTIAEGMPSASELEEFFAAAEKSEQKRFANKYNYDIVKDVPLAGKYQWVRVHLLKP